MHVLDLEDGPKWRGLVLEEMRAERYPTIRWHFLWGPYVVVGLPELVEAMDQGAVPIKAAAEAANLPPEQQREVVAEARQGKPARQAVTEPPGAAAAAGPP
jgi:hypothetical protein